MTQNYAYYLDVTTSPSKTKSLPDINEESFVQIFKDYAYIMRYTEKINSKNYQKIHKSTVDCLKLNSKVSIKQEENNIFLRCKQKNIFDILVVLVKNRVLDDIPLICKFCPRVCII